MESLREFILLFKKWVTDRIATCLNEQKVDAANEYALTHKSVFVPTTSIRCSLKASESENPKLDNDKQEVTCHCQLPHFKDKTAQARDTQ